MLPHMPSCQCAPRQQQLVTVPFPPCYYLCSHPSPEDDFLVHSDIFFPLLSYSHPVHTSRCSCVSSASLSQNLHSRLVKDLLLFTLTPLVDLALTLIHILLFGRVMYVWYFLSSGSAVALSPTFLLASTSSLVSSLLSFSMASVMSPCGPGPALRWVVPACQLVSCTRALGLLYLLEFRLSQPVCRYYSRV